MGLPSLTTSGFAPLSSDLGAPPPLSRNLVLGHSPLPTRHSGLAELSARQSGLAGSVTRRRGVHARRRRRGPDDGEDEGGLWRPTSDLFRKEGEEGRARERERETASQSPALNLWGGGGRASVRPVEEREGGEGRERGDWV
ncbi:hypothetical protein TIFTF001_006464 [Ficus carica]|uniref:Uncharacterized protein n=1 Tax=Ficus carica TaxID=3494 RepID=A0AA87ZRA0_FICCA|nr:hypothetical protein TIFTF001_006464 [Ficus carica]